MRLTCTSDSGAGESVLPEDWFPEIPKQVSEESGTTYAAANGSVLRNEGKKVIEGYNSAGKKVRLEWQLANVTKPLLSVGKLTQARAPSCVRRCRAEWGLHSSQTDEHQNAAA